MSNESSNVAPPAPAAAAPAAVASIAVITCAVLEGELTHLAKSMGHVVHFELLPQGLHNEPHKLRTDLQLAIDRVERDLPAVRAIVLGYGLCSRGTEGVRADRCQLVIARAHDCITLLLGCKKRYAEYVAQFPGTYWYSPGWNRCHTPPGPERYEKLHRKYAEQFGEEDADFLMESEQAWFSSYHRATYVDVGVGVTEKDLDYTRDCARWLKWDYDRQHGDIGLLRDLLEGHWDAERFLVIPPGKTLRMTADERIIETAERSELENPNAKRKSLPVIDHVPTHP